MSTESNGYSSFDYNMMRNALALGRRGHGNVWPNPAVGCVIVSMTGKLLAQGWTQPSGRPHAETYAIQKIMSEYGEAASEILKTATAYVTLEPCSHFGKTGPCAQALVDVGIQKVVVATLDPDERVSGRGIEMLRAGGVDVSVGLCREEADSDHKGFFYRVTKSRPLVTLKVATTMDGFIASRTGKSKWITGDLARQRGHLLRSSHDAILVGSGTVKADNPSLNCRFSGAKEIDQPVRIVVDTKAQSLTDSSNLVKSASVISPVWLLHDEEVQIQNHLNNSEAVSFIACRRSNLGGLDIEHILAQLAEKGITRLLVEGGGTISASFLKAGLVDEIYWFQAPSILGGDGLSAIGAMHVDDLREMSSFEVKSSISLGRDTLTILSRYA
ncbi:MAG: bifunctional diaminohydroxyphosphoribosylaminopyrimidine deaminase/5-amino-6-(5-phosphoribosylamino)uracil reductase RibD [Alphaproteobacteria bacterium]|nr:bifunctional diaminohydroxyphosphoribosylaminopyrimidine deaminase/5-amino-6-(5-phosphoribosylamino)uracil reductase RibD [Alphaproteobacteria bacterium]